MNHPDLEAFAHGHVFLSESQKKNEKRTWIVIALTAIMMVVEIISGIMFGSMALLADGWHMASHAAALSIAAFGYWMARRHATNPKFSFGTGKIGELAGYSSAMLLAAIALVMIYESLGRFFVPVKISFDEAILVGFIGLIVNLVSAFLLKSDHHLGEDNHAHTDHNLKAAYVHVLTDAMTSVFAIIALVAGRFLGWVWMDPLMGIVGGIVIIRWAYLLLKETSRILLDMNPDGSLAQTLIDCLEAEEDVQVTDIHVWRIGPGHLALMTSLAAKNPKTPEYYKSCLSHVRGLSHVAIEVNTWHEAMPEKKD